MNMDLGELPATFGKFLRKKITELRRDTSAQKVGEGSVQPLKQIQRKVVWHGLCVLGDLCGESHMLESCSVLDELSPKGRLATIQRYQLPVLHRTPRQQTLHWSVTNSLPRT